MSHIFYRNFAIVMTLLFFATLMVLFLQIAGSITPYYENLSKMERIRFLESALIGTSKDQLISNLGSAYLQFLEGEKVFFSTYGVPYDGPMVKSGSVLVYPESFACYLFHINENNQLSKIEIIKRNSSQ